MLGVSRLEAIDLANVNCTVNGIHTLIKAWYNGLPLSNLSISFYKCNNIQIPSKTYRSINYEDEIIQLCNASNIPITRNGLYHSNGYRLTIYIS